MSQLWQAAWIWAFGAAASIVFARRPRWANACGAAGLAAGCLWALPLPLSVLTGAVRFGAEAGPSPWPLGAMWVELTPLAAWLSTALLGLGAVVALQFWAWRAANIDRGVELSWNRWLLTTGAVAGSAATIVAHDALFRLWGVGMLFGSIHLLSHESSVVVGHVDRLDAPFRAAGSKSAARMIVCFWAIAMGVIASQGVGPFRDAADASTFPLSWAFWLVWAGALGMLWPPGDAWGDAASPSRDPRVPAALEIEALRVVTLDFALTSLMLTHWPQADGVQSTCGTIAMLLGVGLVAQGVWASLRVPGWDAAVSQRRRLERGLLLVALGVATSARSTQHSSVSALCLAGLLIQCWAGSAGIAAVALTGEAIRRATGTADPNRWGGLMRTTPLTATACLMSVWALSGAPLSAGFAGQFLMLSGVYEELSGLTSAMKVVVALAAGVAILGMVVSAAASLSQVMTGLLGEPRSVAAARAHDAAISNQWPIWLLIAGLLVLPFASVALAFGAAGAVDQLMPGGSSASRDQTTYVIFQNLVLMESVLQASLFVGLWGLLLLWARMRRASPGTVARSTWTDGARRPIAAQRLASFEILAGMFPATLGAIFPRICSPTFDNRRATIRCSVAGEPCAAEAPEAPRPAIRETRSPSAFNAPISPGARAVADQASPIRDSSASRLRLIGEEAMAMILGRRLELGGTAVWWWPLALGIAWLLWRSGMGIARN